MIEKVSIDSRINHAHGELQNKLNEMIEELNRLSNPFPKPKKYNPYIEDNPEGCLECQRKLQHERGHSSYIAEAIMYGWQDDPCKKCDKNINRKLKYGMKVAE